MYDHKLESYPFSKETESMLNISISTATVKHEMNNASGEHIADECTAKTSKEDEVESAKAQMTRVREENAKLKMLLEQIENDYKSLQTRFFDVVQQAPKKSNIVGMSNEDIEEEHDLVSLRLGRSSPSESTKDDTITSRSGKTDSKDGLKLGLDCNFQDSITDRPVVPKNDSGAGDRPVEAKEDEAGQTWPPSKVLKTMRSGEDELSLPTVKRARVSVRARCDSPTLHDGCQWRKYGQKIAKGNPCPRAYYRCTVGQSCPVRKQVQRCAEDMSILITTYEGTHNHPLPISATAMASTTSAAASMLLSGSSTSQSGLGPSAATPAVNLGGAGLNVNLSDHSKIRPFCLPNSSVPGQFPTITLDLTSTPSPHFNIFSSSFEPSSPTFPSLNFTSPESSLQLPSVWSNGYFNYKTSIDSSVPPSKQSQELHYQQYLEKNNQAVLAETLTKAITSDPNIRSVLAAAISSVVASGGSSQAIDEIKNLGQNSKWVEQVQVLNSNPVSSNGNKGSCGSSFLSRSTSLNSQSSGSLRLQQQPPFAFSISNSSSRSTTVDNGDQTNR